MSQTQFLQLPVALTTSMISSITLALHVTATVSSILHLKYLTCQPEIIANAIIDAEKACIKLSMFYTKPEFDAGKLSWCPY